MSVAVSSMDICSSKPYELRNINALNKNKESGDDGWTIKHYKVVKTVGGTLPSSEHKGLNQNHRIL